MIITLQPSAHTDHITDDGTELQQLPYPFHVDAKTGLVQRQDFWSGRVYRIIGFVGDPNRQEIDLTWRDFIYSMPECGTDGPVGMYVITADDKGTWSTHIAAISTVKTS